MKRDNQSLKAATLLVLVLAISTVSAGFFQDVLWWYFQQLAFGISAGSLISCWGLGGFFGLVFFNDDGAMINECLGIWDGSYIEFPLDVDFE